MGCISLAKRLSTLLFQNGEQVTTEEEPAVTEHDREDIGAHRLARQDQFFYIGSIQHAKVSRVSYSFKLLNFINIYRHRKA